MMQRRKRTLRSGLTTSFNQLLLALLTLLALLVLLALLALLTLLALLPHPLPPPFPTFSNSPAVQCPNQPAPESTLSSKPTFRILFLPS